ncbi:MAG: PLP-dependent transferase [Akkermansiaceae bacterium]|nr:PLP-dependent transferase [Akkermansiaceae bacterium]
MRDLQQDPAWRTDDLGRPLPDSPHACAVCLPTWDSVVGYEENDPAVTRMLRAGYPRFFLNPFVEQLNRAAEEAVARTGERVVVFPGRAICQRAQRYVERYSANATRVASYEGLQALVVREEAYQVARDFWRHAGEVVSSRLAEDVLAGAAAEAAPTAALTGMAPVMECAPEDLFLYESGMAAIFAAYRAATRVRPGKQTLQIEFPYVDALKIQEQYGTGVVFAFGQEGASLAGLLRRIEDGEFAAVLCEAPSNPLLRTVDLAALSEACRSSRTPLVVDDTVCSHLNVDAMPMADLVTTSLTKWVSGAGDVMAGSVKLNPASPLRDELHARLLDENPDQSRLYRRDAEVLVQNAAAFRSLVASANRSGEELAEFLADHEAVAEVCYPKFTDRQRYDAIRRPGAGYGGLISIILKKEARAPRVYDALRWCKGPSLGTRFSLACPYTMLAHYHELEWAAECGVSANLLRLSVGEEPVEPLREALADALALA